MSYLATKADFLTFITSNLEKVVDTAQVEINLEKEKLFAYQAMTSNSYLMKIGQQNPGSLIKAVVNLVLTGATLNPIKKFAYLIPRDGEIQLQFSYKGMINLVQREGAVKTIYAEVVRKNDVFEVEKGTDPKIVHKPDPFSDSEIIGVYAVAVLKDDFKQFVVLSKQKIETIRSFSKVKSASSPWNKFYDEMAKKTAIHNLCKTLPLSDRAMQMFNLEEKDYNFDDAKEEKKEKEFDF